MPRAAGQAAATLPVALHAVTQEDVTGCGLACVAMLAGESYGAVRRTAQSLGIDVSDSRLWSDTTRVRALLGYYGVGVAREETPFTDWASLPALALLATKWHLERGAPHWHWAVYWRAPEGAVVLDPKAALKRHARRDFARIRPRWSMGVTGHPAAIR